MIGVSTKKHWRGVVGARSGYPEAYRGFKHVWQLLTDLHLRILDSFDQNSAPIAVES